MQKQKQSGPYAPDVKRLYHVETSLRLIPETEISRLMTMLKLSHKILFCINSQLNIFSCDV